MSPKKEKISSLLKELKNVLSYDYSSDEVRLACANALIDAIIFIIEGSSTEDMQE